MDNLNADVEALVGMTPIKILSQNMNSIAQAIDTAATNGNKQQVIQLVASAQSLLGAITKLNQ